MVRVAIIQKIIDRDFNRRCYIRSVRKIAHLLNTLAYDTTPKQSPETKFNPNEDIQSAKFETY